MEELDSLLKAFFNHFPESCHPKDQERFVQWAIKAHLQELPFPLEDFLAHGIPDQIVRHYEVGFLYVGYTLDALGR